jgi:hypothetical protein
MAAALKPAAAAAVAADVGVGLAPVAGLVAAATGRVRAALRKDPLGCCVFGACALSSLLSLGCTHQDRGIVTSFVRI